ncbi:DUF4198 domain-containing protein [Salinimonas sediminis]|uniref:DUF4198 domain-containing protein n=1 Tax=Salinimonas sediminis TaxID=2303538 RepID=A0A346NHT8_9ALTE|nr:DUF4198 domain-containing protein [Salinimonas sediminis]AXR05095.1 DUF4198 domain-containing protein [Salinimonas sediminis]
MKKKLIFGLSALALLTMSPVSQAHRAWIKPTTTVVSGQDEWVSFDAAIANGIFTPDHVAMGLDSLEATSPSGKAVNLQHQQKLKYRSVFDLQLVEEGTYKIASASGTLMARWEDAQGERHFWPGRGKTGTAEQFEKQVPKQAKNLEVSYSTRRIEVFVTAGQPSDSVLKTSGQGLELVAKTHPNDLYTSERIEFAFTIDGEPAKGAQITVVKEGEKYRDNASNLTQKTDEKGYISFTLDEPGMYWLEAEYADGKAPAPAKKRQGMYVTTLEVLPL